MKYLLDTNSLSKSAYSRAHSHKDICILEEVRDEFTSHGSSNTKRIPHAVEIINIEAKHLRKLQELMVEEGANFDLIRLYTAEGTADAMILAFVLCERDNPDTLFPEEYVIVTTDTGLQSAAAKYGVKSISKI